MRRFRTQQRKRQTWLALPASGIEEVGMAEERQQPTAEAIKQKKKREKQAAKNAALGIEKFSVEVAGVFMSDLKRLMKEHDFNNQQEVYQNLLRNVIAADFETAAQMLKCVTTPFVVSEEVSRDFRNQSLLEIRKDAGDEIIRPSDQALLKTAF